MRSPSALVLSLLVLAVPAYAGPPHVIDAEVVPAAAGTFDINVFVVFSRMDQVNDIERIEVIGSGGEAFAVIPFTQLLERVNRLYDKEIQLRSVSLPADAKAALVRVYSSTGETGRAKMIQLPGR